MATYAPAARPVSGNTSLTRGVGEATPTGVSTGTSDRGVSTTGTVGVPGAKGEASFTGTTGVLTATPDVGVLFPTPPIGVNVGIGVYVG